MGFKDVKRKALNALATGNYQHEVRNNISEKNKLQTGEVDAEFVAALIKRSSGDDYSCSPHHRYSKILVHILIKNNWYVKFYFIDPDTFFISVHQA